MSSTPPAAGTPSRSPRRTPRHLSPTASSAVPPAAVVVTTADPTTINFVIKKRRRKKKGVWAEIPVERIKVYNDIWAEEAPKDEAPPSPTLLYNTKLRATQEDAINLVNYLNMSAFRKQFNAQEGSVDMTTFCTIVKRITTGSKKGRKIAAEMLDALTHDMFMARLIELFREIDQDGNGSISWEEFAKFILDKASMVHDKMEVSWLPPYPTLTFTYWRVESLRFGLSLNMSTACLRSSRKSPLITPNTKLGPLITGM